MTIQPLPFARLKQVTVAGMLAALVDKLNEVIGAYNELLAVSQKAKEGAAQGPEYVTVKQLVEHFPHLTVAAVRSFIFCKETNGFASCVRRVGRRILISVPNFKL